MFQYWLLLVVLELSLDAALSVSQAEIDRHLELGREFLARGQLQDALSHYHAAVEGDPNNYLTYYKRGTVYLALGKAKFALFDLDKVLELKPDFHAARLQRGNVLLKQAELDAAEIDFHNVLAFDPSNEDALNGLYKLSPVREDIQLAEALSQSGDYPAVIQLINRIIEICPWASHLRELRAESHAALGDYMSAVSDIRSTTKLLADNTQGYFKLSSLLYRLGQVDESLKEIRECLKLDPEHKQCFPHYKKVKKIAKFINDAETSEEAKDYETCIEGSKRVLKNEPHVQNVRFLAAQLLCRCHLGNNDPAKAIESCHDALEIQRDPGLFCDRAEAYIAAEQYDDAIRDFKDALEIDPNLQRAKDGVQRAQRLQKQSESRDYYKILSVPRTASKKEIVKAYRKAAQKWHPDNFQEGEEKKRAEKKFIDIAAAKEVLTDPEKRAKFDQGEDPLDPESGRQQGFNPFHEFSHFARPHGSPFQFKFHFP
ncbi:dnaJ homolog subfamily C member 3 [Diprion similis]|uniref:dnaJ homolog subfamily C member 3 n=1 Tax=Diprion similis TaxID=362088 RepID=UPI001EF94C65|nr:dnaJ homolog subfamily C member 3 [Diprion similis]